MGAGWGFAAPGCRTNRHSPFWVLADDGVTPVQVDEATHHAWMEEHPASRPPVRVGADEFPGGCVSTVFVGLDVGPAGGGPPQLWETAVLMDDGLEFPCLRWSTADEAGRAHRFAVELFRDPAGRASIIQARRQALGG